MSAPVYRRSTDVDTSTVGDRVIVFERTTKRAIVLNPTGAQLWQLLESPRSASQLIDALQTQFAEIPAAQIKVDVEKYLGELQQQNLIVSA